MTDESSHSDQMQALVSEFTDRRHRGENPTIAEYCHKYPDLAEQIRYVFPALLMMEDLNPALDSTDKAEGVPLTVEHVGDYRILGEIGRGGMGVVYEAEQESLGRRVALKVLSERPARDDSGLVRFQREARAAAKMHHTNIVPVFEIGQEDGYVFYAMQLIQGQSLDLIIKDLVRLRADSEARGERGQRGDSASGESPPTPVSQAAHRTHPGALARSLRTGRFRAEALVTPPPARTPARARTDADQSSLRRDDTSTASVLSDGTALSTTGSRSRKYYRSVARIGRQVAEALVYSHARGVIHRDIKPSNLLLDAAGVVWITDFGIAKSNDQNITHTGDIVGTVRYMSPERFRGRCDERSDIYALGLTLYELAVLRPAFDSADRLELIEKIKESEPAGPRTIDPHFPIDLETIILKAIDKEPASRYQSADDLAEDLRRFIEDEPIRARRVSIPGRLLRWSRRNKKLAMSLSAVAMLIVFIAVGATVAWFRESNLRKSESQQRQLAEQRGDSIMRNLYFAEMNLAGQAAAEPFGADTVKARLSKWLPQKAGVDLRAWEWYYLYSLVHHRELFSTAKLSGWIESVDWNPDGTRFVASIRDFGFKMWDASTGQIIQEKASPRIKSVAWSPNGSLLASTNGGGTVDVWDASTGQKVHVCEGYADTRVNCVAWSPDAKRLATGSELANEDHMLRIWDAASGAEVRKLDGHTGHVQAVQWSPDGTRLASASQDGTARIWDPATGAQLIRFDTAPDQVGGQPLLTVCWSPDGAKLVSAGADEAIRVWDVATQAEIVAIKADAGRVTCVSWRPDSTQLASAHDDGTVRLWDAATGGELTTLPGHRHSVRCVKWSPDGSNLASASNDRTVRLWKVDGAKPTQFLRSRQMRDTCLDWSHDCARLASGNGWPKATNGVKGEVTVWDAATGKGHVIHGGRRIWAVAWSPDDKRLAFGGQDSGVLVWDTSSEQVTTLPGEKTSVRSIAWNHDGSRLASAEDQDISIWNMDTHSKSATITNAHEDLIRSLDWTCDSARLASGGGDGQIKVWNAATGRLIRQVKPELDGSFSVRWSPDGTQLATTHNGAVLLWDALTGALVKTLDEIEESFAHVDWSPDSRRLATASRASVSVWDVATGHVALRIPSPDAQLKCVRWSPDGRHLAASGGNAPIRIYDATTGYEQNGAAPVASPHSH